jgi:hypothetical protein
MVWTQPMTFTAGSVLTAAQLNLHLRDNLMASEAATVTEDHDFVISAGYHQLARRKVADHLITTGEATSSTDYADLATTGPTVTVETTNRAWVIMTAHMQCNDALSQIYMSYAIERPEGVKNADGVLVATPEDSEEQASDSETGDAGSRDPHDNWALAHDGLSTAGSFRRSYVDFISANLTPGLNTFTCKYRVASSGVVGTFTNRQIIVIPM